MELDNLIYWMELEWQKCSKEKWSRITWHYVFQAYSKGNKSLKNIATITTILLELGSTYLLNYASIIFIENKQDKKPANIEKVGEACLLVDSAIEVSEVRCLVGHRERSTSSSGQEPYIPDLDSIRKHVNTIVIRAHQTVIPTTSRDVTARLPSLDKGIHSCQENRFKVRRRRYFEAELCFEEAYRLKSTNKARVPGYYAQRRRLGLPLRDKKNASSKKNVTWLARQVLLLRRRSWVINLKEKASKTNNVVWEV